MMSHHGHVHGCIADGETPALALAGFVLGVGVTFFFCRWGICTDPSLSCGPVLLEKSSALTFCHCMVSSLRSESVSWMTEGGGSFIRLSGTCAGASGAPD